MLRELLHLRQVPSDRRRRCFYNEELEVVVWYEPDDSIFGFQISYDPKERPRALTWTRKSGFSHASIDGGDDSVFSNRTPMLRPDGTCNFSWLNRAFLANSSGLPADERSFIEDKLSESFRPA